MYTTTIFLRGVVGSVTIPMEGKASIAFTGMGWMVGIGWWVGESVGWTDGWIVL